MDRQKIDEMGAKLDVTEEDFRQIRRQYFLVKILAPITGAFIIFLSTLTGYLRGRDARPLLVNRETGRVYPYVIPSMLALGITFADRKRFLTMKRNLLLITVSIVVIFMSIIGYFVAYDMGQPVEYYSGSIMYGVYSRER